jgi:hypothetical protein
VDTFICFGAILSWLPSVTLRASSESVETVEIQWKVILEEQSWRKYINCIWLQFECSNGRLADTQIFGIYQDSLVLEKVNLEGSICSFFFALAICMDA